MRPFNWCPDVDLSGLRIGYLASEFRKEADGEDPTGVYVAALDVMRGLGADLQPVSLPDYPADAIAMVLRVEASAMFDDATLRGELDVMTDSDKSSWPNTFRAARTVTAVEYLRAQRLRTLLMRDVAQVMQDWDVGAGAARWKDEFGCDQFDGSSRGYFALWVCRGYAERVDFFGQVVR